MPIDTFLDSSVPEKKNKEVKKKKSLVIHLIIFMTPKSHCKPVVSKDRNLINYQNKLKRYSNTNQPSKGKKRHIPPPTVPFKIHI